MACLFKPTRDRGLIKSKVKKKNDAQEKWERIFKFDYE